MLDQSYATVASAAQGAELAFTDDAEVATLFCDAISLEASGRRDEVREWAERAHDLLQGCGVETRHRWRAHLQPFFLQSPFLERAWRKPRGYAGDYLTIQMMYDARPQGSTPFARAIDAWALDQPAARAVRNRRHLVSDLICRLNDRFPGAPLSVTSLGCGPAAEVFDSARSHDVFFNLIDIDEEALAFIRRKARSAGLDRLNPIRANIIKMALGRMHVVRGMQHGFYSLGVIDYLNDELVVRLLNRLHEQLHVGGEVLLGNFRPEHPNAEFFVQALEWPLCLRSHDKLMSLVERSRFATGSVGAEREGVQLFVSCIKT